ncbi:hypothetical protein BGZ76_000612 [Entomortierella beljakovae]|nr:hypothetical protein BGZ76_000612 [Entomortierella beljakovae]
MAGNYGNVGDILILVEQLDRVAWNKKDRLVSTCYITDTETVGIELCCYRVENQKAIVGFKGIGDNEVLETFKPVILIDSKNGVFFMASISIPTKLSITVERSNVMSRGKFSFKILLQKKTNPEKIFIGKEIRAKPRTTFTLNLDLGDDPLKSTIPSATAHIGNNPFVPDLDPPPQHNSSRESSQSRGRSHDWAPQGDGLGYSPHDYDWAPQGDGLGYSPHDCDWAPQGDGFGYSPRVSVSSHNEESDEGYVHSGVHSDVQYSSRTSLSGHANTLSHSSSTNQEKSANKPIYPTNGHKDIIPTWIYEDIMDSLSPRQESFLGSQEDESYDVHFIHWDKDQHINIIGAHKRILDEYSGLRFFIVAAENARDALESQIGIKKNNARQHSGQTPITVDISFLSLPAFRALITYIYTKKIDTILENIPGMAVTISTKIMEYIWTPVTDCTANRGETVLSMDLVLILAHKFGVRGLFEAFSRLILYSLSSETAIAVLVHTAEIEDIKANTMDYIKRNYENIFGQGRALSDRDFEEFEDKELCVALKEEIEIMIANNPVN